MSGAFRECREGDADEGVPIFMGMQAGEKTGSGMRGVGRCGANS